MNNNQLTTTNNQVSLCDIRLDKERFPRLHSYSREQAVFEMSKIVSQAFLYRGQSVEPTNVQFIASSLVDELRADTESLGTYNITFAEIGRVVKKSVLTDEMYGISVASLYKVIIAYVKGEGHKASLEAMKRRAESERQSIRESVIAPMLQTYTKEMLNKNK